jgi:hypothetical protein
LNKITAGSQPIYIMLLVNKTHRLPFLCKEIYTVMLQWDGTYTRVYSVVALIAYGEQRQLNLCVILHFSV